MLKSSLGAGAAALLAACGNGDADIFGAETAGPAGVPDAPLNPESETATTEAETVTTEAETVTTEAETASTITPAATEAAGALGPDAELIVAFTYQQLPGGKSLPPYLAVWVEDANGDLVHTIELWYQQDSKGPRWLPDLKRWFTVDEERVRAGGAENVDVISSATRLPGSYSVVWDGTVDGVAVPTGRYFVCIEAARERGPYSLIREPLELGTEPVEAQLPDDAELVNATVELRV